MSGTDPQPPDAPGAPRENPTETDSPDEPSPAAGGSPRRRVLLILLKLCVAAALIYWLVYSGRLKFADLRTAGQHYGYLLAAIGCILVIPFFGAVRWMMILRQMGVTIPYREALGLQFIGQLFNNVIFLGPTSGDVAKGAYLVRRHEHARTSHAVSSILADRLIGSQGLNLVALTAILIAFATWDAPAEARLVMGVGAAFFGIVFLLILLALLPPAGRWLLTRPWLPETGWRGHIRAGVEAFQTCTRSPRALALFLGISVLDHTLSIGSCWLFARAVGVDGLTLLQNFALVPITQVANAMPGTIQGFGAWEYVLDRVIDKGAMVALLWHLTRMGMGVVGGIGPFLLMRFGRAPRLEA